jgi:hypothetical protein
MRNSFKKPWKEHFVWARHLSPFELAAVPFCSRPDRKFIDVLEHWRAGLLDDWIFG